MSLDPRSIREALPIVGDALRLIALDGLRKVARVVDEAIVELEGGEDASAA